MAQNATWKGQARIRGYNNTHRMAMLTFCLIGLQQVFHLRFPVSIALY